MQTQLIERESVFLRALQDEVGTDPDLLPPVAGEAATELPCVAVGDPRSLTDAETAAVAGAFRSRFAAVALDCGDPATDDETHPLVRLGEQLAQHIPARWPVNNASDGPDGTVKIYDVGTPQESRSLTALGMAGHQDGWLSLRGVLSVTGLWADTVPARAAATYSQNIVRLALDLRADDREAFRALFADDAVAIRRTADGTVVATGPVLYTRNGWTYSLFREPNDEYEVASGSPDGAAHRAVAFLAARTGFQAPGSTWTRRDRPRRALLLNNRHCVHGRTAFTDDPTAGLTRVIASKWWICDPAHRELVWD